MGLSWEAVGLGIVGKLHATAALTARRKCRHRSALPRPRVIAEERGSGERASIGIAEHGPELKTTTRLATRLTNWQIKPTALGGAHDVCDCESTAKAVCAAEHRRGVRRPWLRRIQLPDDSRPNVGLGHQQKEKPNDDRRAKGSPDRDRNVTVDFHEATIDRTRSLL
ncbi:MAG TPA: hypothetical protein DCS05_09650 [Nitrospiraceae bacterium]|nr:hypothetical protein [Nitrospiraceae bacterium]